MKIEPVPEPVLASAPVEESDVEKAKQELTVNVLRVMMVPPGVQKFFNFIYESRGAGFPPDQRWSRG